MARFAFALMFTGLPIATQAGKYNPTLSIGDAAPAWEMLAGADGETHAVDDFQKAQVLVVAFTCNTCPYAVDHEDRLVSLAKAFKMQPVQLVAVNCNTGDEDTLETMQKRAMEKSFSFPYLKDTTGSVGKAYGATRTPEFVVLDRERRVVYLGAMDDDPTGRKVEKRYVEEAVRAVLEGRRPRVAETPPIGCGVKYPRERRQRAGSGRRP